MQNGKKKNESGYNTGKILLRILAYTRKYKLLIFLYVVLSIVLTLINLAFANLINSSIGSAISGKQGDLLKCIQYAVVVILIGIAATYLSKYIYGVFSSKVMLDIQNSAVEHLQKLRLSFIENNHTGDILSRYTNDMRTVQNFIGDDLFSTAIMLASVIITAAYLISVNWKLYLASRILMPPVLYLSTKITKPMGKYYQDASAFLGKANSLAQDSYGGIFIIKAFNLENYIHGKFSGLIKNSYDCSIKGVHRLKWMPVFNIILWSTPFTICLIYGAYLSINNQISPGQLPAFVYLLNTIVWPVSRLPRIITYFRSSLGTAQRFFEVLDNPAERVDGGDFQSLDSVNSIVFKNVTFSYEGTKTDEQGRQQNVIKNVLDGLSFELKSGSTIALVGASGCGKSTVLKLISGFYDYQGGEIELFGHEMHEWSIPAIRSKISFVSQDAYLFPCSVYDNILYGKLDSTRDEVVNAAKAANAHEFIMGLPESYDTLVGERGIKLSGGQKQRISLARAFLKNAPVILFDEPTSALDTLSESLVQGAMNSMSLGKSAIIVTHRLSTIKDVDEILVMDNGCIVEKGTHSELASSDSLYSMLYSKQTESGEDKI